MTFYLIDSPVTPYDDPDDIRKWINLLEQDFPQDNEQVQDALEQAREWLKEVV